MDGWTDGQMMMMMMKTDRQADRETVPGLLLGTRDAGVNETWPLDSGNSRFSVGDSCSNTVTVTGNSPSLGIAMESYLSTELGETNSVQGNRGWLHRGGNIRLV